MTTTEEQFQDGYCPAYLSTGQPVKDYLPREFVATGRSVSNSDVPPPAQLDDVRSVTVARTFSPHAPSVTVAQDLAQRSIELATIPAEQLTDVDRLVLAAGGALLTQLIQLIESRLDSQDEKKAERPRGSRKAR